MNQLNPNTPTEHTIIDHFVLNIFWRHLKNSFEGNVLVWIQNTSVYTIFKGYSNALDGFSGSSYRLTKTKTKLDQ